ncbi:Uncharacterized protein HZ326_25034 [Fusarium oxysporum f. sp. albedinis]|nr:hypothetical protein HZ326_25393 [Fusarium oxysporum f. sp. albedinis]KAJ0131871.1 Uncharacterized protein HZ326_25034 [Fusarium oxysporum f. sp. albedinis]
METLAALGRSIPAMAKPTFSVYSQLLNDPETAAAIHSTRFTTYSFGQHEKHKLDIYTPSANVPLPVPEKLRPVIVFFFGGGFVAGGRTIPEIHGDLAYKNFGHFFAERLGFEVVIPGYRLLSDGAKFPSGAEDVQGALEWVEKHYATESRDIFVLGNSAGGVHLATWMFGGDHFAKNTNLLGTSSGPSLSGIIFLGTPFQWDTQGPLKDILVSYYGGEAEIRQLEPASLMMQTVGQQQTELVAQICETLVIISELDPEPIEKAGRDFAAALGSRGMRASFMVLEGHNHFSPPLALSTRISKEEDWGAKVGKWMVERLR